MLSPRDEVHVMKRDAYGRLDANSYPLIHRLGPDEPTTPWTINVTDRAGRYRILPFDFDGKTKAGIIDTDLMEQAQDQCEALSRTMTELGIKHVVCKSSGTGGRHIFVVLRDGADTAAVAPLVSVAKATYRQLDIAPLSNERTGAIRPPLSPHRDGSRSTVLSGHLEDLLAPSTTIADLVALTALLEERKPAPLVDESRPSGPIDSSHRVHRQLSKAGLAHMATIGGGADPSHTGFSCLMSAAAAGWTLRDVEHAAKTAPGMEHYRTRRTDRGRRKRSPKEAQAQLERQWVRAIAYTAVQGPARARKAAEDLTALNNVVSTVQDMQERFRVNPGRWGASEAVSNHQTILRVVAYLTLHTGKPAVAAAIRDLGLMAGLGRTTADSALNALAETGYIEQVTASADGNAAEWRLTPKFSTTTRTVRSQPLDNTPLPAEHAAPTSRNPAELFNSRAALIAELESQLVDQRHDLFSRKGLGHLAGKLYALLGQHPALTVETAAKLLGVTRRHTATILSRLRVHKLIVKHRDGWARAKRDLRDRAAKALGVYGLLLERATRYRVEREVWLWWQAEVTTMNASPRKRPRRPHVTSRPIFQADAPGERVWPRYPRSSNLRGDHRAARQLVAAGHLNPESRWQYLGEAA